jgi:hypothetical protein
MFYVPRREFERKFEIVLLAENAPMELKSSAKESEHLPSRTASSFIAIQVESKKHCPVKGSSMWPAGN